MLYAVSRLVAILSIYSSVGYTSGLLGAVLLGTSMNPPMIKQGCAVMAPYMCQMDRMLEHVDVLVNYDKLVHVLSSSSSILSTTTSAIHTPIAVPVQSNWTSISGSSQHYSSQVEELQDDTPVATVRRAATTTSGPSSTCPIMGDAVDMAMIEELNIDEFDGVIDLTEDEHALPTDEYQHRYTQSADPYLNSNTIRLRKKKSSVCN